MFILTAYQHNPLIVDPMCQQQSNFSLAAIFPAQNQILWRDFGDHDLLNRVRKKTQDKD